MEFVRDTYGWREGRVEGTYKGYKSVECRMAGVHDYTKFLKRGFGRGTDHASADVRAGLMTREEAFELAKQHDSERPDAPRLLPRDHGLQRGRVQRDHGEHRNGLRRRRAVRRGLRPRPGGAPCRPWQSRRRGLSWPARARRRSPRRCARGRASAVEVLQACLRADRGARAGRARLGAPRSRGRPRRRRAPSTEGARRGEPLGTLAGVPVGVKDIFNTLDLPTEMGSPSGRGFTPGNDARAVFNGLRRRARSSRARPSPPSSRCTRPARPRTRTTRRACRHVVERLGGRGRGGHGAGGARHADRGLDRAAGELLRRVRLQALLRRWCRARACSRRRTRWTRRRADAHRRRPALAASRRSACTASTTRCWRPRSPTRRRPPPRLPGGCGSRAGRALGRRCGPTRARALAALARAPRAARGRRRRGVRARAAAEPFDRAHAIHDDIYERSLAYYFKDEDERSSTPSARASRACSSAAGRDSLERYKAALRRPGPRWRRAGRRLAALRRLLDLSTGGEALVGLGARRRPDHCLVWTLCGAPAVAPALTRPRRPALRPAGRGRRLHDYGLLDVVDWLAEHGLAPRAPTRRADDRRGRGVTTAKSSCVLGVAALDERPRPLAGETVRRPADPHRRDLHGCPVLKRRAPRPVIAPRLAMDARQRCDFAASAPAVSWSGRHG